MEEWYPLGAWMQSFVSYEGEGDLLGLKTLFVDYPMPIQEWVETLAEVENVQALFVNLKQMNFAFPDFLARWYNTRGPKVNKACHCTVEYHVRCEDDIATVDSISLPCRFVRWFLVVNRYYSKTLVVQPQKVFYKIRVLRRVEMDVCEELANRYAARGENVLLMPEFQDGVGDEMMNRVHGIHPAVRVMPPVHQLLGIR